MMARALFLSTSPEMNVITMKKMYIVVATSLVGANMLLSCFLGPDRKQVLSNERIAPKETMTPKPGNLPAINNGDPNKEHINDNAKHKTNFMIRRSHDVLLAFCRSEAVPSVLLPPASGSPEDSGMNADFNLLNIVGSVTLLIRK